MFIRFDVIHERDRRTDRQTLHDSIDRACIASRGKKHHAFSSTAGARRTIPTILIMVTEELPFLHPLTFSDPISSFAAKGY